MSMFGGYRRSLLSPTVQRSLLAVCYSFGETLWFRCLVGIYRSLKFTQVLHVLKHVTLKLLYWIKCHSSRLVLRSVFINLGYKDSVTLILSFIECLCVLLVSHPVLGAQDQVRNHRDKGLGSPTGEKGHIHPRA